MGKRKRLAVVHEPVRFAPHHVVVLHGIKVTTPARTIFDLANLRNQHPKRTERALDTAWSRRLVSFTSLARMLGDLEGRGRRGIVLMRTLLEERGAGCVPADSNLERRFEELARAEGFAGLARQVELGDDLDRIGRVDFVELDRRRDEKRYELLRSQGWVVESFTEDDLFFRAAEVRQRLARHRLRRSA